MDCSEALLPVLSWAKNSTVDFFTVYFLLFFYLFSEKANKSCVLHSLLFNASLHFPEVLLSRSRAAFIVPSANNRSSNATKLCTSATVKWFVAEALQTVPFDAVNVNVSWVMCACLWFEVQAHTEWGSALAEGTTSSVRSVMGFTGCSDQQVFSDFS